MVKFLRFVGESYKGMNQGSNLRWAPGLLREMIGPTEVFLALELDGSVGLALASIAPQPQMRPIFPQRGAAAGRTDHPRLGAFA